MAGLRNEFLPRAKALADWFVKNQVTRPDHSDYGRFPNQVRVHGPQKAEVCSTNWTTGMTLISLLMVWQRTRDKRYLESARLAATYLKSIQFLDARNPKAFGLFREVTAQSDYCHPRDALSAAWGLLHLGLLARDQDALWRANVFAEWFRKHAMRRGYPAWTAYTDKNKEPYWQLGSFHGGSPLFFFDLYKATKKRKWLSVGLAICDTWIRTFLKKDGSIRVEVDPETGKDMTGIGPTPEHLGWQEMHKTNDDFTALALLRAFRLSGKRKYLEAAQRFLDWALTQQRRDGAFGKPAVNSAAATLILELMELAAMTRDQKYRLALERSVPHFLSLQELKSKTPRFHGGFYCVHGDYVHEARQELGVRTSCYALAVLLRLEGKRKY